VKKKSKKEISNHLEKFINDTDNAPLTTDLGVRLEHTDDSLKAGVRGPTLMDDHHLREKIMRFDHERIPERAVHARGSGAHGFFECYAPQTKITRASFLAEKGKRTPVFVRFSTVAGSRGSADTARDVRGFATKFYTDDGNFDLVGNNMPVFFIQDGIKFPDLVHAVKPEPHNEIPQASSAHDTFWDFVSLTPESTHMLMWVLSDRAIPRSFAHMEGFGVHTFRLINSKEESNFVKFHWKPKAGVHSLVWDEAMKLMGKDPDFHRRSLFEAIEEGRFPEWELGVQVIPEKDEMKFDFDLLDPTKIVPEELVPVQKIGRMVLDRNPDNFFAETEQVAFCVSNLVPGIDLTNDPLMQARLFSYLDTQLTRLGGPNFNEIPINRPIASVTNHQHDGFGRQKIPKSRVNYFPSSLGGVELTSQKDGGHVHFPEMVKGPKTRERSPSFSDHFSQAALFYQSQSLVDQKHIRDALTFELSKVEALHVRARVLENFAQVDAEIVKIVAPKVGVKEFKSLNKTKKQKLSPALSAQTLPGDPYAGRNIAVLLADGFDHAEVIKLRDTLRSKGAKATMLSEFHGDIKGSSGSIKVDKTFSTTGSVHFDGIFIPQGKMALKTLAQNADVTLMLNEAFKHHKTIALPKDAGALLENTFVERDAGVASDVKTFIEAMQEHRHWERETGHIGV
jgi:catalase